jgi:hypothetical protein
MDSFTSPDVQRQGGIFHLIGAIFVCSGGDAGGLCCAILVSCLASIFLSTTLTATAEN